MDSTGIPGVNRQPPLTLRHGALVGGLVAAAQAALFYFADRLAGLVNVPFLLFDALAQVLPGAILTIAIDGLQGVLAWLGMSVRATAKPAEQILAVLIYAGIGMVAGAILFRVQEQVKSRMVGVITGLVLALPLLLTDEASIRVADVLWMAALMVGWGGVVTWASYRLNVPPNEEPFAVEQIRRREFLIRLSGVTAAITVVGAGLGSVLGRQIEESSDAETILPNADAAVQPVPGTRPEYTPVNEHYRTDINLDPVVVDDASWVMRVYGKVRNPLNLTLEMLRAYEAQSLYITLACVSNRLGGELIGTTRWTGVPMKRILEDAQVLADGAYLLIRSADGFYETVAIERIMADERIMLCYEWDGRPLDAVHGFPARIYIPDKYGMKQPKWITEMEVVEHYEEGFWTRRGWDEVGKIKLTSAIDIVAVDSIIEVDGRRFIPIGGIAYAGVRGISKVEVRVDEGEWVQAQLRDPLSDLTWVIWRYDWPFEAGQHTFYVRAVDGNGVEQITDVRPPHPSGASGIHRISVTIPER